MDEKETIYTIPIKKLYNHLIKLPIEKLYQYKTLFDDAYYNSESLIGDDRYDILINAIEHIEHNYTHTVGAKLREGDNKVELPYWLGSADKILFQPELDRWIAKNQAPSYILTEKLDGVSCLCIIDDTPKLYTRGDGSIGSDISYLAPYLRLPKIKIAVRGELIMKKKIFEQKYKQEYKNARNMVSGLIGSKTVREGLIDVDFVVYEIIDSPLTPEQQFAYLSAHFKVVHSKIVPKLSIDLLKSQLLQFKNSSLYELDGIVVQSNKKYQRNNSGNPDYMFAFKMLMEDSIFETKVVDVEWNLSRWGQLKPVVIVEEVDTGQISISRATGHNAKYIVDNNIGVDTIVAIVRSNDVIPYIYKVIRPTTAKLPNIDYEWDDNEVNFVITNTSQSSEICINLLTNFFSKIKAKFVSKATITKIYNHGHDNLMKIIQLTEKDLLRIETFEKKSAQRIYTNIHTALKTAKLSTILGSSGVFGFGVGEKRIELLFDAYPNIIELYNAPSDKLKTMIMKVEGFSNIMTNKIVNNISLAHQLVEKLKPYISDHRNQSVNDSLSGQKFVLSGFRDVQLEQMVLQRGGKVTGSVSKQTTAVITKDKSAVTEKLNKARELGLPIYNRDEFISLYIND